MKFHSLFRVELGRLFRSRLTWAALGITIAGAGAWPYALQPPLRFAELYLSGQSRPGRCAGRRVDFALLSVLELDRVHRSRTDVLTDSMFPLSLRRPPGRWPC